MKQTIVALMLMGCAFNSAAQENTPPLPPPPPPVQQEMYPEDYVQFLRRNPAVRSLGWTTDKAVIVRLRNGKEERYLLDKKGLAAVTKKYGALPVAPPPPPPLPVPPPPPPVLHN